MINENLFKKSISFWNLKNDEFELLAQRENITYKVYDLKGSCFVLRFHRKNYSAQYSMVLNKRVDQINM